MLVAEVVVGGLARRLGLRTPRLVALDLDPEIARYEADEEVQDLLNASAGPQPRRRLPARRVRLRRRRCDAGGRASAPRVLWLDAFTANVDRTWRNPNLLLWHGDLWVIDHGASLYFHHGWSGGRRRPGPVRRASRGTPTTTCSARTPPAAGASTPRSRRGSTDEVFAEVLARGARRVAGAGARRRVAGRPCGRRTSPS